jgi:PAS domain S-box-containing protein
MNIKDYIINQTVGNLYWKDIKGRYLGCNKSYSDMIGLSSPEEIVGKTDRDFFLGSLGEEKLKLIIDVDREIIRTGKAKTIEETGVNSKYEITYYITYKIPLTNKNGKIFGIIGTSIDITERKKVEEELRISKEKAEEANRAKMEFLSNAVGEISKPFERLQKILKTTYKKVASDEVQKFEFVIKSMSQILEDMESFAKFDLIHKNQFSEDEVRTTSKFSKNSSDDLKIFQEFYRQFNFARRESECVYYMVRGMTAKQIGRKTNLSYRTVEFYLNNAKLKLGCRTKQALISKIFESGVI